MAPPELHPNVLARLRGTAPRLADATAGLDAETLTLRLGDKWSIQQNVGHLLDLEELWATRVQEYARGTATLTTWDVTNEKTERAGHNERPLAVLLAEFARTRAKWLARLAPLATADYARSARHPRLGTEMRLIELLVFVAEHDDHHLARIFELRDALG